MRTWAKRLLCGVCALATLSMAGCAKEGTADIDGVDLGFFDGKWKDVSKATLYSFSECVDNAETDAFAEVVANNRGIAIAAKVEGTTEEAENGEWTGKENGFLQYTMKIPNTVRMDSMDFHYLIRSEEFEKNEKTLRVENAMNMYLDGRHAYLHTKEKEEYFNNPFAENKDDERKEKAKLEAGQVKTEFEELLDIFAEAMGSEDIFTKSWYEGNWDITSWGELFGSDADGYSYYDSTEREKFTGAISSQQVQMDNTDDEYIKIRRTVEVKDATVLTEQLKNALSNEWTPESKDKVGRIATEEVFVYTKTYRLVGLALKISIENCDTYDYAYNADDETYYWKFEERGAIQLELYVLPFEDKLVPPEDLDTYEDVTENSAAGI